jgi:hypothetical protein
VLQTKASQQQCLTSPWNLLENTNVEHRPRTTASEALGWVPSSVFLQALQAILVQTQV